MEKLLDNEARGKRTILGLKIFFVVSLALSVLVYAVWSMANGQMAKTPDAPMAMGVLLLVIGNVCAGFFAAVSFINFAINWLLWIFRSAQNLKTLQPDSISPWLAVVLCCLPFIGQIAIYCILRSLAKRTQSELENRNVEFLPLPMKLLNLYLVLTVVSTALASYGQMGILMSVGAVLSFVTIILLLKILTLLTAQEQKLFKDHEEQILRKKVDQVLREREIEKAASQIQEATYETSGRSGSMDEPPPSPEN